MREIEESSSPPPLLRSLMGQQNCLIRVNCGGRGHGGESQDDEKARSLLMGHKVRSSSHVFHQEASLGGKWH